MARFAVAGATGLVGSRLTSLLRERGHEVARLVRRASSDRRDVVWDPASTPDGRLLYGFDGVVNLAGSSIASGLWTRALRREVLESRIRTTRHLAAAAELSGLPVLVNASAVGIYGDRGDEWLDEESSPGSGFLASVCTAWEEAADSGGSTRVAKVRFATVLSPSGGALDPLRTVFRLGAGGPIGNGRQWFPWISVDDAAKVLARALEDSTISGPVLAASPVPVRQGDFARTLGKALGRPAVLPLPGFVLRALPGRIHELFLSSQRCRPRRLEAMGFDWSDPDLGRTLARFTAP